MSDIIQMELNLQEKSLDEMNLFSMQKQIELMHESMHKVRKKLFGELSELKKLYAQIKEENDALKSKINPPKQTEWNYQKEGVLFDVK